MSANNVDEVGYADPIWGGSPNKPNSYGFGALVFYLPILAGFVLAYFTKAYAWQLVGLLLGFIVLLAFAAGSHHFDNKVFKYFFVGFAGLIIFYELVHAGIGSNRALTTYNQWNGGYLGIGIIYALLLISLLFSIYLLSKAIKTIYQHHLKPNNGCLRSLADKKKPSPQ